MPEFIYRFSIGDSTNGQVGACFDVRLEQDEENEEEAVQAAKDAFEDPNEEPVHVESPPGDTEDLVIYVNPDKITVDDIVDIREVEHDKPA